MNPPICPYCEKPARLTRGFHVYPGHKKLADLRFWRCEACDAHVGCHPGGSGCRPLGSLANAELRRLRQKAHAAFDPIWKSAGLSRNEAYQWLGGALGIKKNDCHIGSFNADQCQRTLAECAAFERRRTRVV